jgi:hypothetical protein
MLIASNSQMTPPEEIFSATQSMSFLSSLAIMSVIVSMLGIFKAAIECSISADSAFESFSRNLRLIITPLIMGCVFIIVDQILGLPGDKPNNTATSETVSSTAVPTTSPTTSEHTTSIKINWEPIAWGVLATVVVTILSVIAWLTWKYVKKTRMQQKQWGRIKEKIGDIKAEYAAAESDPTTIVSRPLLLDVEYQYTKAFHEQLADADRCVAYGELDKAEYQLTKLTTAWQRLLSQSKHEGIPRVSAKTKARAQRLLDMVLSTTTTDGERATAWQNLTEILNEAGISEIIQEKALAMRELQAVATLQLEA